MKNAKIEQLINLRNTLAHMSACPPVHLSPRPLFTSANYQYSQYNPVNHPGKTEVQA